MAEEIVEPNDVLFQTHVPVVRDTILGKRKRLESVNVWEWTFLAVSTVNIIACIVLSAIPLSQAVQVEKNSPDFTFTILLIINSVFCLFYVIHGLLKELRYEIFILILATCVVFFYCIIEYIINGDHHNTIKLVRLIMVCVMAPINIGLAAKVGYDFGWLEFRILGAAEEMLRMYRQACWFLSLIKFDLQVAVSFLVLILKNGKDRIDLEIELVLSIGITVSVIWFAMGVLLVRWESKVISWIFAVVGVAAPAFVLFKVVRAYMKYSTMGATSDEKMLLYSTVIIGALLLLIRILVYVELIHVYRDFGKGLRHRAFEDTANERSGLLSR